MTSFNAMKLGRALAAARISGAQVPAASLPEPSDLAAAAQAQAAFFHAGGKSVRAWKAALPPVGAVAAPMAPLLGPAEAITVPWQPGVLFEVEIAVRLATDLPAPRGKPYTRADIVAAIASVHLGLEIVRSRIVEGGKAPFLTFCADLLGNDGYVLGPALPKSFVDAIAPNTLVAEADGTALYDAPANHVSGDVLAPLLTCANAPSDALGGFRAEQIVTTGTLCGAIELSKPSRLTVTLAGQYGLVVNFARDR